MSLMKKLAALFGGSGEGDIHREYVRCTRCGEKIAVRVNLNSELTPQCAQGCLSQWQDPLLPDDRGGTVL